MSLIREGWDRARPDVPERADRALEQFWVSTAWLRSRPRGRRLVAATWRAASADLSPSFKPVPPARHTVGGTMNHLDDLLAGIDVTLSDDILTWPLCGQEHLRIGRGAGARPSQRCAKDQRSRVEAQLVSQAGSVQRRVRGTAALAPFRL
jgi:hypothetical protein